MLHFNTMKKIIKKPAKKKKPAEVDCINVFWDISPNWESLSYEKKLEHYWKYQWDKGQRIYGF